LLLSFLFESFQYFFGVHKRAKTNKKKKVCRYSKITRKTIALKDIYFMLHLILFPPEKNLIFLGSDAFSSFFASSRRRLLLLLYLYYLSSLKTQRGGKKQEDEKKIKSIDFRRRS
jgi:hypothetical protein